MSDTFVHSAAMMGTVVTIQVVGHGATPQEQHQRATAVDRAVEWFRAIEECCTRFDEASELRQLCTHVGEPVPVSEMLFQVLQFALSLAEESGGAFDPTVGHSMEANGFSRNFRTGASTACGERPHDGASDRRHQPPPDYRDVRVDPAARTVTLLRAIRLDLGAVAKGLAVDAAAHELRPFANFAIDAGGDLYLGGVNPAGEPWSAGIRHPREPGQLAETVHVSDMAVCTSGDYENRSGATEGRHHIIDNRTERSVIELASVTVIAPSAMVADGLATAAFVLGPVAGRDLLQRHGVRGIMITPSLQRFETRP